MIWFDVKSLFTNITLEQTITITLSKVYNEKKVETNTIRNIIKNLS